MKILSTFQPGAMNSIILLPVDIVLLVCVFRISLDSQGVPPPFSGHVQLLQNQDSKDCSFSSQPLSFRIKKSHLKKPNLVQLF